MMLDLMSRYGTRNEKDYHLGPPAITKTPLTDAGLQLKRRYECLDRDGWEE